MSYGKVILGVLAGAATGAALGILFAPDSGKNTRRKISDKSSEYADDVKDKFNDFVDDVNEKIDEASGKIHENTERFRRKSKETISEAKQ